MKEVESYESSLLCSRHAGGASGLDVLGNYYGTDIWIGLHHHLGDCYLVNIDDQALVYAD
jgi:hypothetical protein